MRDFFLMMGVQFISYLNLTINFRAIAHNQVWVAMITDGLAVAISIFIIKKVSGAEVKWTKRETGMVIGGSLAAAIGISLTRAWG
jgi:hypothetical protein